jgi:hypothetical protein
MTRPQFEYQTVDIPVLNGRPQIDATCSLMAQEGWRPMVIIAPDDTYPRNSIVFEKEVTIYA